VPDRSRRTPRGRSGGCEIKEGKEEGRAHGKPFPLLVGDAGIKELNQVIACPGGKENLKRSGADDGADRVQATSLSAILPVVVIWILWGARRGNRGRFDRPNLRASAEWKDSPGKGGNDRESLKDATWEEFFESNLASIIANTFAFTFSGIFPETFAASIDDQFAHLKILGRGGGNEAKGEKVPAALRRMNWS